MAAGALDAEAVRRRDCTIVYAEGSYSETARRVGVDRKTARLKVDPVWLAALRGTRAVPCRAPRGGGEPRERPGSPTAPRAVSPSRAVARHPRRGDRGIGPHGWD
jgi:hypothetical protein